MKQTHVWAKRWPAAIAALAVLCAGLAAPALGQGWWPFGGDGEQRPPVPSEPVYRPDPAQQPAPVPRAPPVGAQAPNWSTKNPICLQLEKRLVQESQKGNQWRTELPKIEAQISELDRRYNVNSQSLDRGCYEYFLFTKSFRSTAKCRALRREVDEDRRRLSELESQRQSLMSSGGRSYQDEIIRELARNGCGQNYVEQARRQGGSDFWSDSDSLFGGWTPRNPPSGVTTYRTLCVRTCDGFYFPISFATLPSHFATDAEACQARCAAPAELYYYPNPGGTVNQSVAYATQQPYTEQKFAFVYRKELVQGCSCKADEYAANDKAAAQGTGAGAASGFAPTATPATARGNQDRDASTWSPSNVTTGSEDGWAPQ